MALIRDFSNPYLLTDYTQEINLIPNTWGLINELGLFQNQSVAANTITFEQRLGTIGIIGDRVRGDRNLANKDDTRRAVAFSLTHHPLDDQITAQDIASKRAYGSADQAETEAAVVARKLERLRMNHSITLEAARMSTLVTGAQFSPNGTVVENFYTTFGITRKSIDFTLGTAGAEVIEKGEEGVAFIQDEMLAGNVATGYVAICSPTFFSKLIKHAKVVNAFQFYSSTQEPLRTRLGSGQYRRFEFGGITYIEYRGAYNGVALVPANEAYLVPTGTQDCFITYSGPANKLGLVNTLGEQNYVWAYRDDRDEFIQLQSESNFLNLLARPQVVVKLTTSN